MYDDAVQGVSTARSLQRESPPATQAGRNLEVGGEILEAIWPSPGRGTEILLRWRWRWRL